MHKENVSKHEAIEKAKQLCGNVEPVAKTIKPSETIKPNVELLSV